MKPLTDPAPSILRIKQVEARCGIRRSTIYLWVKNGRFPAPVQLGSCRAVGWVSTEIDRWLSGHINNRRAA